MLTVQVKLSIEDIISSIPDLELQEVEQLQNALAGLKNEIALQQAVKNGLDDIEHGRTTPHDVVMNEIKSKYNY